MMWHRLFHIGWFLCGFEIKSGEKSCLTWCIEGETLKLICRVDNFSDYISITDPQGKQQAHCDLSMTTPRCISNGSIKTNSSTKDIEIAFKNIQSNMMNGQWTCSQRHNSSSTIVSTEHGIIIASTVNLFVDEWSKDRKMAKIRCNSCREPRGNHVEFLVNNVTVDSIIHNRLSGQCRHINGECKPEICTCSSNGREFTRMIELTTENLTISCEMSFSDKTKQSIFTIIANIHFNGKQFTKKDPIKLITKKPEGTWWKEEKDQIIPDKDKESTENATVTEVPTEKGFQLQLWVPLFVISVMFGAALAIFCICITDKKERRRPTTHQYTETNVPERLYHEIDEVDRREYADTNRKIDPERIYAEIQFNLVDTDTARKSEAVTDDQNSTLKMNESYEYIAMEIIPQVDCGKKESPVDCGKKESPVDCEAVSRDERQKLLENETNETGNLQNDDHIKIIKKLPTEYKDNENDENKDTEDNLKLVLLCKYNIQQDKSFIIGGMTTTSNGVLLVCDVNSNRVFQFDQDFVYINTIETDHQPYDIAVIPNSERAVTTCHLVPFLQMLDIKRSKLLESKLVNKDIIDSGIFCTNLYVIVGGRRHIYLYSHEISLEKTISIKGSEGVIRSLCCANEIVCLIEQGSNTVQFLTLSGENESSYHPKYFNLPTKAIVGKSNTICILERVASKIHHLSSRGEFIRMIDLKKYGLTLPVTICFCRDCTKLYVSNESGSLILEFDVTYQ